MHRDAHLYPFYSQGFYFCDGTQDKKQVGVGKHLFGLQFHISFHYQKYSGQEPGDRN